MAISGVRQSFEPFRKRVPSFDAPLHRSVATLRLTGSPAPSEADDVALAKGPRKAGGSNLYGSHPQESYAGAHRRQNQSWPRRGFSYSTASVTKWSSLSPSATAFAMSAAPWTSGFRKRLGGLQHQLQLGFAVVARLVFATAMTGDRIVGLFLDLGITPLRLDIIAERVVRFVAQLRRRVLDAEPAHPLADIAAGGVATAVILTADRRSPVLIWRADRRQPCGLPR